MLETDDMHDSNELLTKDTNPAESEPLQLSAKDTALAKIKKCLALAASPNPHEAAAATRQAQKLMAEYGLTETDGQTFWDRVNRVIGESREEIDEGDRVPAGYEVY